MDLLTREDIPTHFWITHEKLQLSCLREKLICILSIFFLNNFSWWHFLLPIYDREMGNYEFLNRFAVKSTCGAIPILNKICTQ